MTTNEHDAALESTLYDVHHAVDAATALDVLDRIDVDGVVHDATSDDWRLDVLETVADATDAAVLARTPDPDGEFAAAASARGATGYCTHDDDLASRIAAHLDRYPTADQSWYRRLHDAVTDPVDDADETARRLLEVGCDRLDLPYGFLTRFDADEQHIAVAIGDHEALQTGNSAPMADSYCQYTADTDGGYLAMDDAREQLPASNPYEAFELGCYVGGLVEPDGEVYGSLCFAGDAARDREFDDADRTFVEFAVELFEHELERDQHRRAIEAANDRYEALLERIDDGFFALDENWRFTYVNERAGELLGRDPDALVDERIWSEYPSEQADQFRDRYERAMTEQTPVVFEEHFEPLDAWLEVSAYPSPDGLSVLFQDVTDRKRYETQLTDLLDAVRDLYGETEREDIAQRVVDATHDILGYQYVVVRLHDPDANTLPPTATSDAIDRDAPDRPTYDVGESRAGRAFERNEVVEGEAYLPDVHGPLTSAQYYPIDSHGVLTVATRYDETDIAESDQRLAQILAANAAAALDLATRQRALERYESVLENVQDMVFVLDETGVIEYATGPLADAIGQPRTGLVGVHASEFVDADVATLDAAIDTLLDGEDEDATFQFELVGVDGPVPIEVDVSVLPGMHGGDIVGVVHDISDLTETRARLESENARFRQLFESLPDPVVENRFVDGEPVVERVNPAFEDVFGYDERELVGERINDYIVPEDRRAEARSLDRSTTDAAPDEPTVVSSEVVRQTSQGMRHFLFRGISYLDGDVHRGYGIYTDITSQHERERRLQVLNTILRHNLRTEMTLVSGYVDELAVEYDDHDLADRIRDAVDEVVSLSDKARELERALEETPEPALVDVVTHVQNGIADATNDHPDRNVTFDADSATVVADHRLEIVVKNLVENAFEHGGGEVTVSVTTTDTTVEIRVDDDGPGIPEFERALVSGDRDITQLEHGSGLGLWIATWLLNAFDGDLRFENDASTVVAVVPRAPTDAQAALAAESDESAATED